LCPLFSSRDGIGSKKKKLVIRNAKSGRKEYICAICNKHIKRKDYFARHIKKIHDGHTVKCDLCETTCKKPFHLAYHRMMRHDIETKGYTIYRCPVSSDCKFKTLNQSSMNKHVAIAHSEERTYGCEICGKMFKTELSVKKHVDQFHHKIRKFKCDICGHGFNSNAEAKKHKAIMHIEEGKKPDIMCQTCGKVFAVPYQLVRHTRYVHDVKKDWICDKCPPGESIKYDRVSLLRHIAIMHDKTNTCCICQKAFWHQSGLRLHWRAFHMKYKQFHCKQCKSSWTRFVTVREHFGSKHFNGNKRIPAEEVRKHPAFYDTKEDNESDYPSDQLVDELIEKEKMKRAAAKKLIPDDLL